MCGHTFCLVLVISSGDLNKVGKTCQKLSSHSPLAGKPCLRQRPFWADCHFCSHMSQIVADLGTSVSRGLCAKLWSARQPRDGPSGTWVLPCGGPPGAFFIVPSSSRAAGTQVPHRAWPCGDDLHTEEGGLKTFTPCRRQHAEHRGGRGVGGRGGAPPPSVALASRACGDDPFLPAPGAGSAVWADVGSLPAPKLTVWRGP